MNNINVKQFVCGLMATNVYCVRDQDSSTCVVIDLPYGSDKVVAYVKENKLTVSAILLTHGHFDHCGGVSDFIEVIGYQVPIYLAQEDSEMASMASSNRWNAHAKDCHPTNLFDSNIDSIHVGVFDFQILHTPGHTPGGACYIIDDYLFSGDTLFAQDVGRTDLSGGSKTQLTQSLKQFVHLPRNYFVCPGHDETTNLLFELKNNPYLNNIDE